jgi:hypothetical protein
VIPPLASWCSVPEPLMSMEFIPVMDSFKVSACTIDPVSTMVNPAYTACFNV